MIACFGLIVIDLLWKLRVAWVELIIEVLNLMFLEWIDWRPFSQGKLLKMEENTGILDALVFGVPNTGANHAEDSEGTSRFWVCSCRRILSYWLDFAGRGLLRELTGVKLTMKSRLTLQNSGILLGMVSTIFCLFAYHTLWSNIGFLLVGIYGFVLVRRYRLPTRFVLLSTSLVGLALSMF